MRIGSSTGRSGAHIARVANEDVSVDQLDMSFDMDYDVLPLGKICLCDIDTGTIENHRVDGWNEAETFGPGELFSLSPPDRPYTGRIAHARYSITMLSPELLTQVAGTERPVRLLDHRATDALAAQHLRSVIAHVRDTVLGMPGVHDKPLVMSMASRYLAAAVLHAFPNTALTESGEARSDDAHSRTLRRAIDFIEANADRDIHIAEIAGAAHVSPRTIQLAFRRHLGFTPTAYLRRTRLDRARAELRAASPEETTVTHIAARWGYVSPSRFAAHYRTAFGESPSQTLHQT